MDVLRAPLLLLAAFVWVGQANSAPTAAGSDKPAPDAKTGNVTFSREVTVKQSFDSNVYLQDHSPDPANVAAALAAGLNPVEAGHHSFVTTLQPRLTMTYDRGDSFSASMRYEGEYNRFNDADSEDFLIHSMPVEFKGRTGVTTWQLGSRFTFIEGDHRGPTFARPGDVPAIGAVPLRDRRDAFIFRGGFEAERPLGGNFFLRPVVNAYVHDFKTEQRSNPDPAHFVYENYVDRQEISGGLHVGYTWPNATKLSLGYVYGRQDQDSLLGVDSPYDNSFHRILLSLEGAPRSWLKFSICAGPDIRDFDDEIPGFDDDELLLYVLGSVSLMPSASDTITLFHRRYEQPAFGGPSMYEDITYEATWQHRFNANLATRLGFRAYGGDWQAPANREDWIYTPGASLTYTSRGLTGEVAYSYDWADSEQSGIDNSEGREFTRHTVSLLLRYAF